MTSHDEENSAAPADLDLSADAELLPELKAAVCGDWIHHPLLVMTASLPAYANRAYLAKKKRAEDAKEAKDWEAYVFMHERPYRIPAFKSVASEMDDQAYWELLARVYVDSENSHQNLGAFRSLLASNRRSRDSMMSDEERDVLKSLPDVVTIYRGYGFDNLKGWSWTISREKAEWFARRSEDLGGTPRLASGKVKKSSVVAYLDCRSEKEILCDPHLVAEVTTQRLDGKEDAVRVPRTDKLDISDIEDEVLGDRWDYIKPHMEQNPTMSLSELHSALCRMHEELEVLAEQSEDEAVLGSIAEESLGSELLRNQLEPMKTELLIDVVEDVKEGIGAVRIFIERFGEDSLCGDFDLP